MPDLFSKPSRSQRLLETTTLISAGSLIADVLRDIDCFAEHKVPVSGRSV